MDAPNGNRYVERTVHMPYFRTDNEGDCLKLTYASNGKNFYYEVDSSILESNVLVYQDGTLYYRFRKKSPSGQYGAEVTFRIDNASYESLNEVLSSSQLPIMSLEQYDKEDEQAILGLIAHSSVSGVVAENQMLSLNHRDYSRLNMVVRGNAITITSNDRELYRSSKVASDNMFGILVAKLNLNQSGDKQIVTDKSKFVFAFISDHLPR